MCACYFNSDNSLIMRRGDTATITIESDDIPFENYEKAYFAIINRETLQPVLPELYVTTTSTRRVQFTFTAEQTETLPQPTDPYAVYGYTFKLCTSTGVEDTFIPETDTCSSDSDHIIVKPLPKVLFYPKTIEGTVSSNTEE